MDEQRQTRRDDVFNRAMGFVDNTQKFHPGISNLYVFTVVDKENNIVDEKYGMNLVTNNGFTEAYINHKKWNPGTNANDLKMYVGNGSSVEYYVTDTTLESECFGGLAATLSNSTKEYAYPMYYAPSETAGEGLITLISKFAVYYYNYDIDSVSEPTYISEYGLGTSKTALWTHSHIYDSTGERSSITKEPGQKLIMTVYLCLSLREYIIQEGWNPSGNNGKNMIAITTNQFMYHRMFESSIKTFKRNEKIYERQTYDPWGNLDQYHTMNTTVQNAFINSSVLKPITLTEGSSDSLGYFDGFIFYTDGIMIISPETLPTAENISFEGLMSQEPYKHTGFADKFGMVNNSGTYDPNDYPPITRLTNARAYLFNWKSGTWNNEVAVYNPDAKQYTETMGKAFAMPIYYSNRGEIVTRYLYQNMNPDDPILSFDVGSTELYATNKYWTNTTNDPWIWIQDMSNVPATARQCKYWISNSNSSSLKPVRQLDTFQLLEPGGTTPADNGYETYLPYENSYEGSYETCDNADYGWYMFGNLIYYPANLRQYFVGGSSLIQNTYSFTYGQYILTFISGSARDNKMFITDMAQAASNIVVPNEVPLDFTGTVNVYDDCYCTQSGTGIVLLQSMLSGVAECQFIDLRSGYNHHLENWKMSSCIWGTNKIAYVPAGSDNNIYIYNIATQARDGDPIPFPTGMGAIKIIFGHSKYIWFGDGTNCYVVDITTQARSPVQISGPFPTQNPHFRMSAVDDALVIYNANDSRIRNISYINLASDPVNLELTALTDFNFGSYTSIARLNASLRYINKSSGKATMVLIASHGMNPGNSHSGAYGIVVDFGLYLKTNTVKYWHTSDYYYVPNIVPFGDNVIYLLTNKSSTQNWLPIKLTGKTTTVTSANGIKNISEKTWVVHYTNNPSWGDSSANRNGIPPGNPIAITDGTGVITGWS